MAPPWYVAIVPTPRAATVLIVDDDPVISMMYSLGLERAGYTVLVAKTGQAGLDMALKALPDLILLDVRIPILDGIEVLARLAADSSTREIPVVMLSNYSEPALVDRIVRLGAKQYIVKIETTPSEVAAVVARHLGTSGES
ncbi:MAG: response regulator [Candidatus Dormibacteraceae bacterium]